MKRFIKIAVIVCFFVFSLFFLSLSAQCQWSSYPSINININFYGFPGGSFPSSDSYWQPAFSQQIPQYGGLITGTPYAAPFGGYYSPPVSMPVSIPVSTYASMPVFTMPAYTSGYAVPASFMPDPDSIRMAATASKFNIMGAASDGEYIFVLFGELNGESRSGLAILEPAGPDTYRYLSHIVLSEGGHWYNPDGESSMPTSIIIKDNLAIIGGEDLGMVYFVDISHKDKPQLINKVSLADNQDKGVDRVLDLIAAENGVLFVCIEDLDGLTNEDHYIVHALDISDPAKLTKEEGLLGSYTVDKDYKVYGMISAPGYLYLSGKKYVQNDYGLSIHIINSSDPKNLALVKVIDDLGAPPAGEPEISVGATDGSRLFTIVGAGEFIGPLVDGEFQLKIFEVSDPANPQVLSASKKLTGSQIFGSNGMVLENNYAYVLATTYNPRRTKVYVFDVSDLQNPDLVDITENSYGLGLNLYFADNDNLFLVTDEFVKIFNTSNPENLPMAKTVDVCKILGDELKDWGSANPPAYSAYGGMSGGVYGDGGLNGSIGGLYPLSYGGTYPTGVPYNAYGTGTGPSAYGTGTPIAIPPSDSTGFDSNAVNLDVNGDGMVTPADALYIFHKYLEIL